MRSAWPGQHAGGGVILEGGTQCSYLLDQCIQLPCPFSCLERAVKVVGAVWGIQREHPGFVGEEGKVDLFQCLRHLRQVRVNPLIEQGLREGVSEDDAGCSEGEGRGPLEVSDFFVGLSK